MKRLVIAVVLAAIALVGCSKGAPSVKDMNKGKAGYTLDLGQDFDVGMNSVDDMGISVALVVDVSGSMIDPPRSGGDMKYKQAAGSVERVLTFLYYLSKKHPDMPIKVTVLTFSDDVATLCPLTKVDDRFLAEIPKIADSENYIPTFRTAMGKALEAGCAALAQSGTVMKSLIVITDGENTATPAPEDVLLGMSTNNNDKCRDGITVYTDSQLVSFIGFDVDACAFDGLSKAGARVIQAKDEAGISEGLTKILDADITKLEGK